MTGLQATYIEGDSLVHRADARVKVLVLLAYSIAIFFAGTWPALLAFVAVAVAALVCACIPFSKVNGLLVPVYVLAAFSVLFNVAAHPGPEGLSTGLLFGVRMVVLVAASFVVCLTTSSSQLLDAFAWFVRPLRRFGVPADDIAFTLALSVRFIPVIEREFHLIRAAQIARGADSPGSFLRSLRVWGVAFTALFIGLFRHADNMAMAMDARCYGAADSRTLLPRHPLTDDYRRD